MAQSALPGTQEAPDAQDLHHWLVAGCPAVLPVTPTCLQVLVCCHALA